VMVGVWNMRWSGLETSLLLWTLKVIIRARWQYIYCDTWSYCVTGYGVETLVYKVLLLGETCKTSPRSLAFRSRKTPCVRALPHRTRAAATGSDLCLRREGFRTVLRKIASSPSNRRRADAADQSRSRRAADSCVLETDLPGGQ
jgi:hypothetical protein